MMKKLSLRMRLTLLSALVMASVAVILTSMFLFGADRIFVRDLEQKMMFQPQDIIITSVKKEGVPNENMDLQEVTVSLKKARSLTYGGWRPFFWSLFWEPGRRG